jgi:chlorite dismutase
MSCHSYVFFDADPSIRKLNEKEVVDAKKEFAAILENSTHIHTSSYGTLGLKANTRFMLHFEASEASDIHLLMNELIHTSLGRYLTLPYTLLGLTRPSPYRPAHVQEKKPEETMHPERRYLVVYPFTKTAAWHLLPMEERRAMMGEHIAVGRKHTERISQLLLYSYGIDDQEFIVSYECDDLLDFQTLVIELRATRGRAYTQSDTPIFTCVRASIAEALDLV